ncbi:MAG: glycosyltransferase family 2 protein [Desulfobacteraceae bacterium]|nr:glycosyltransferase family 2 protein [Desulfobacteraceae bacterium]
MSTIKIAVLMTVYNRKKTTLACLDKLFAQTKRHHIDLRVYMVDDGSDETGIIAKDSYPGSIVLIKGTGDLFWCGGMRLSFSTALEKQYDYYLWLNDDSMLYKHALDTMIETSLKLKQKEGKPVIVAGSFQDPEIRIFTYGGWNLVSGVWPPLRFIPVSPDRWAQKCNIFNGNCVLIPAQIAQTVGNIKAEFIHAAGDYDYGLRAQRRYGYSSWIAPGYIGTCSRKGPEAQKINGRPFKETLQIMKSDAAMHRVRDWLMFSRQYGKFWKPVYWLSGIFRLKFPAVWFLLRYKKSN